MRHSIIKLTNAKQAITKQFVRSLQFARQLSRMLYAIHIGTGKMSIKQ